MDHATGDDHSTAPFIALADLASSRVGGRALAANDDFFAPKSNLVQPEAPVFVPGKFTARGKWMDGWESRRRRTPGHDWCVVALGMRGVIRGVNVDTRFFTGNFPSHCSIEALDSAKALRPSVFDTEGPPWVRLLPKSALQGDRDNLLAVNDDRPWTHVRLNIFPDGGVARLRVYGEVTVNWDAVARRGARQSILRRSRAAASSSRRATCTSARATTSSCRAAQRTWATAGRRGAGAGRDSTGPSSGSAHPAP